MKPQIIDRFVYVKGKKISEVENTGTLHGKELIPIADNNQNFHTTVDQISEYVDNSHDYLTTEDYNDLKSQIDSERTDRQEADNELNQSIQDTKSELHSTISNVESELLNEVNDLQGQIDSINDTGIANGVTLDTVQTITGEKTFTTVPKSTADATEDTDLVNKKYVDNIANASFVFTSEELNSGLPSNRLNECINAYNNNKTFCIQRDNGEKIPAKIKIDTVSDIIIVGYDDIDPEETEEGDKLNIYSKFVAFYKSTGEIRNEQHVSFLFSKIHGSNVYLNGSGKYSRPTKETVGLGNVDNTSDLDKPISNATKEYIDEKIANKVVYANLTGLTLDAEEFESLKEDIESNSVFLCNIAGGTVQLCNEAEYIPILNKLRFIFIYTEDNLVKILTIEIDGNKYIVKRTVSESPDLSNYLTEDDKTELETEIGDLSENVNAQVTALQKKDSTIEGNVTNLTETVDTINTTVSGLDNKYLSLSGGTVSGNLQVDSSVKLRDNNDILDIKYSDPDTQESEGRTFIRYNTSANGFIDMGTSGTSGPSSITAYQAIRINKAYNERDYKTGLIYINGSKQSQIFHENNISGSKVTTNDISGGLNITSITQSAYDELQDKDANTLYIITE